MSAPIDYQVIQQGGQPAFAVVPYDDFMNLLGQQKETEAFAENGLMPQEILERHTLHNVPLVKAWREHLGLTQAELATKSGIQQPSIARIEKGESSPQKNTLEKLANAMNLKPFQIGIMD